jgi:acyl carrier protein
VDDTVVLSTGEKVDALSLERTLEEHPHIERAAIVGNVQGDAILALVQPKLAPNMTLDWSVLTDAVLNLNKTLPFEKRIQRQKVFFVRQLPLTVKNTIHRKRLRKIIATLESDNAILVHFPSAVDAPPCDCPVGAAAKLISSSLSASLQLPSISSASSTLVLSQPDEFNYVPSAADIPVIEPHLRDQVLNVLCRVFDVSQDTLLLRTTALTDLPFTSLASVEVTKALNQMFSVHLLPAEMYSVRTVDNLCAAILRHQHKRSSARPPFWSPIPTSTLPAQQIPSSTISSQLPPDNICITGATCRFSGGIDTLSSYWSALSAPRAFLESLAPLGEPSLRPTATKGEAITCKILSLGDAASGFTTVESLAAFFRIPMRDVEAMSLNTRLVLQMGYEAIEDAGMAPGALDGKKWGVFTAVNESNWRLWKSGQVDADGMRHYFNYTLIFRLTTCLSDSICSRSI